MKKRLDIEIAYHHAIGYELPTHYIDAVKANPSLINSAVNDIVSQVLNELGIDAGKVHQDHLHGVISRFMHELTPTT